MRAPPRSCRSARRSASGLGIQKPNKPAYHPRVRPVPLIVDAGVGTASDAALAMELGAEAC